MPEQKRHLRSLLLADRPSQRHAEKGALAAGPISSPSSGWLVGVRERGKRGRKGKSTELATVPETYYGDSANETLATVADYCVCVCGEGWLGGCGFVCLYHRAEQNLLEVGSWLGSEVM